MPRYKDEMRSQAKADTRQALLHAAIDEFAREGFGGAGIDRISLAAGFAKGTIYNYFPSKRSLMLAAIEEIGRRHQELVLELVTSAADPQLKLLRFLDTAMMFLEQDPAAVRVIVATIYGPDGEFRSKVLQVYQPMFELVAQEIVAQGVVDGVFRSTDVEATSRVLITLYLVTVSHRADDGAMWLEPESVVTFVTRALNHEASASRQDSAYGMRGR